MNNILINNEFSLHSIKEKNHIINYEGFFFLLSVWKGGGGYLNLFIFIASKVFPDKYIEKLGLKILIVLISIIFFA